MNDVVWNYSNFCGAVTMTASIGAMKLYVTYTEPSYDTVYNWSVYSPGSSPRHGDTPETCGDADTFNEARAAAEASATYFASHTRGA